MGEIADAMINGEFDHFTGEYLDGDSPGFPRYRDNKGRIRPVHGPLTPSERKIKAVSKELYELIQLKQSTCETEQQKNHAVNQARSEINKKYGKGWRERGLTDNPENQWTKEELLPFQSKKKNNGNSKKKRKS